MLPQSRARQARGGFKDPQLGGLRAVSAPSPAPEATADSTPAANKSPATSASDTSGIGFPDRLLGARTMKRRGTIPHGEHKPGSSHGQRFWIWTAPGEPRAGEHDPPRRTPNPRFSHGKLFRFGTTPGGDRYTPSSEGYVVITGQA